MTRTNREETCRQFDIHVHENHVCIFEAFWLEKKLLPASHHQIPKSSFHLPLAGVCLAHRNKSKKLDLTLKIASKHKFERYCPKHPISIFDWKEKCGQHLSKSALCGGDSNETRMLWMHAPTHPFPAADFVPRVIHVFGQKGSNPCCQRTAKTVWKLFQYQMTDLVNSKFPRAQFFHSISIPHSVICWRGWDHKLWFDQLPIPMAGCSAHIQKKHMWESVCRVWKPWFERENTYILMAQNGAYKYGRLIVVFVVAQSTIWKAPIWSVYGNEIGPLRPMTTIVLQVKIRLCTGPQPISMIFAMLLVPFCRGVAGWTPAFCADRRWVSSWWCYLLGWWQHSFWNW